MSTYYGACFIFELICYLHNFYACKDNTFAAMMQEKKREKC